MKIPSYLVAVVMLNLLFGCDVQQSESTVIEQTTPDFQLVNVKINQQKPQRRYIGHIRSTSKAELSFEIAGKITHLSLEIGDSVSQGQVLARLDSQVNTLSLVEINANLKQAELDRENASIELERRTALYDRSLVTRAELDVWQLKFDTALAHVSLLKARRDIAQKRINDTELRAPFDGVISQRYVDSNENVSSGQPVLAIVDNDSAFEILTSLPVQHAHSINIDSLVSAKTLDEHRFNALVANISSSSDSNGLVEVLLRLTEQPSVVLTSGMPVEVTFELEQHKPYLSIPYSSIHRDAAGSHFVWRTDQNQQRILKTPIQVEHLQNDYAFITGPLNESDKILITDGVFDANTPAHLLTK